MIAAGFVMAALPAEAAEQALPAPDATTAEGSYAIEYDVSVEEATRRLERIDELKKATQAIVAAEDGRVAGWGIVHEPQFGGWVFLVGNDAPSAATAEIRGQYPDVIVELGATYTLDELDAAMSDPANYAAISEAMWDRVAYREIDVRNNELVVALDRNAAPELGPAELGGEDGASALEALPVAEAAPALEDQLELTSGLPFSVVLGEKSVTSAGLIYGGEHIHAAGGHCTSGFAVKSGSTRGMLTAGHCGWASKHWRSRSSSHTGDSYWAYTQGSPVFGDDGDSQWYTTSATELDDFYYSSTTTRDVTGYEVRSNMFGDWVCHFGINSKQSCGYVVATNFDPNYQPECGLLAVTIAGSKSRAQRSKPVRVTAVDRPTSNSGGATNCTAAGTDFMVFTAMDDVLDVLDVTLATS